MPTLNAIPRYARPLAAVCIAALLVLTGCDAVGTGNTITLQPDDVTFRFPPFGQSDVSNDQVRLNAENSQNFGSYLSDPSGGGGFTKDDVTAARVSRVSIVQGSTSGGSAVDRQPIVEIYPFLEDATAELVITHPSVSAKTVARKEGFTPSSFEEDLNVTSGDITSFVKADGPFRAEMVITLNGGTLDRQYRLDAEVDIDIDVQEM
jgi:hypothetical protein